MDLNGIVVVIVAIICFVAVGQQVAITTVNSVTALTGVANESVTITGAGGSGQFTGSAPLANGNVVLISRITNVSGGYVVPTNNYTLVGYDTTRQAYNKTVVFTAVNSNQTGNTLYVSYTYQPSTYDYSAANRQLYSLIPLGLGVGALIVVFSLLGA